MSTETVYVIKSGLQSSEIFRSHNLELAKAIYKTVVDYNKDFYQKTYRVDLYEIETTTKINRLSREEWGL